MDYSGFYAYCEQRGCKQSDVTLFVNRLVSCFDDDAYDDHESMRKLFFCKDKVVRDKQFYKIKKYAILFYQYLIQQGAATSSELSFIENLNLSSLTDEWTPAEYFRDLNEVINLLSAAGNYYGLTSNEDMHMIKSLAILFWHGVSYRDIINIKKSDVHCELQTIRAGENILSLNKNYFDHIYRTLTSDQYRSFPNGTWMTYTRSEYLFRTYKSDRLTEGALRRLMNHYNKYLFEFSRKRISRTALQDCGIFYKMHYKEDACEPIIKSYEDFQPDAKTKYKMLYRKWENTFYQETVVINDD